ncbi:MAG: galactokinase [Acidimicrobiaceae bacterium]|nr:galactokinase [Acidimicrobiaceae bacterium]
MTGGVAPVDRALALHRERWGVPDVLSRAPGRVNLIGEHTDYNDGFVLPMAIEFDTVVALSRAKSGSPSTVISEIFGEARRDDEREPITATHWAAYVFGVSHLLNGLGKSIGPWRCTIATDVPIGASLSSSAALEVAMARALLLLAGESWDATATAELCQRVEHEVVGMPCGIMDPLISAGAVPGHASLIDCRSLEMLPRRLPDGTVIAILDTVTRHELVDSAYADRRAACERAARWLSVAALRDAELDELERMPAELAVERRRARHVITENERTLAAAAAMDAGDAAAFGALMNASHASLRDDYEVSGQALDAMVQIAHSSPGCIGARMTGGGFAGCAVALVAGDAADDFIPAVQERYRAVSGLKASVWLSQPAAGASHIDSIGQHPE